MDHPFELVRVGWQSAEVRSEIRPWCAVCGGGFPQSGTLARRRSAEEELWNNSLAEGGSDQTWRGAPRSDTERRRARPRVEARPSSSVFLHPTQISSSTPCSSSAPRPAGLKFRESFLRTAHRVESQISLCCSVHHDLSIELPKLYRIPAAKLVVNPVPLMYQSEAPCDGTSRSCANGAQRFQTHIAPTPSGRPCPSCARRGSPCGFELRRRRRACPAGPERRRVDEVECIADVDVRLDHLDLGREEHHRESNLAACH